jgi:thiaminase/transcriptional activator TenA
MTRVSQVLHVAGAAAWQAAVAHPMVLAIADGSLPHATFHRYFTQNVLYLEDYARAIGLIMAKAPDRDAIAVLTRFQVQVVEIGGDPDTVAGRGTMLPTTYAYTQHLLSTCALGDCADGLTAVLPCQWSYGELARPLTAHPPDDPIYADWISVFGIDDYDALVVETTALLDRLVDVSDEHRVASLAQIFDRSTAYEAAFWDMVYGNGRAGGSPDEGGAP